MLQALPKVVLHDHLDGGLRPGTILELASEQGYDRLPASDPEGLARWFDQSQAGSLETYLQAFRHTVGVLQTASALTRAGYEAIVDHARHGVVYAELRFAPSLHLSSGLDRSHAIKAVIEGARQASSEVGTAFGIIVVAMREARDSSEVARLAVDHRGEGVVGFDLAGPERGFPAPAHAPACAIAEAGGLGVTIHAGEGDGPSSVAAALQCRPVRLGHGVRIVEDCLLEEGRIVALGPIAGRVHEAKVPLEVCVMSNVHTGIVPSPKEHPVGALYRAGFAVTVNTDNRLMSTTDMTTEFEVLSSAHGFTIDDLRAVTETAMGNAFCDPATKRRLLADRIRPGY